MGNDNPKQNNSKNNNYSNDRVYNNDMDIEHPPRNVSFQDHAPQKVQPKVTQKEKQILTNDSYGRLLGELENLLQMCGYNKSSEYHGYVIWPKEDFYSKVLNVQNSLLTLKNQEICGPVKYPTDQ
jgi:hypothetical protein